MRAPRRVQLYPMHALAPMPYKPLFARRSSPPPPSLPQPRTASVYRSPHDPFICAKTPSPVRGSCYCSSKRRGFILFPWRDSRSVDWSHCCGGRWLKQPVWRKLCALTLLSRPAPTPRGHDPSIRPSSEKSTMRTLTMLAVILLLSAQPARAASPPGGSCTNFFDCANIAISGPGYNSIIPGICKRGRCCSNKDDKCMECSSSGACSGCVYAGAGQQHIISGGRCVVAFGLAACKSNCGSYSYCKEGCSNMLLTSTTASACESYCVRRPFSLPYSS
jgi:hypothetical protein